MDERVLNAMLSDKFLACMVIFVYILGAFRKFQILIFTSGLIYLYRKSDSFSAFYKEQKKEVDESKIPVQEKALAMN